MASHKDIALGPQTDTYFSNQDLLKNVQKLRDFVKRVKPQDHYARGVEDSRVIMLDTIDIIIRFLKEFKDEPNR